MSKVFLTHPSEKPMDPENSKHFRIKAPPGLVELFELAQLKYPDKAVCIEPEPNQITPTGIYMLKLSPKYLPKKGEEVSTKHMDWITVCQDTIPGIREFLSR